MADDPLVALLRAAEAELARLFAPLVEAVRRFLTRLRGALLLPRHTAALARIVLDGFRALAGATPGAQFPTSGGVPRAPLPALLRAVVRAAAGLVPGADKDAAWDEARSWRAPDGKQLSARLWGNAARLRLRIDATLAAGVRAGLAPSEVARRVEGVIAGTAGAGPGELRRLLVTEGSRSFGQATVAAAGRDGRAIRWLTGIGHTGFDECDRKARANLFGLGAGTYPANRVPEFPSHPHCRCRLSAA